MLLTKTITTCGLDRALAEALAPWHTPLATHSPHKIVLDLAVTLALGGDCLADIALVRSEPGVYGPVADPTVSRMITRLAADPHVLTAIHRARATARAKVWARAGTHARTMRSARSSRPDPGLIPELGQGVAEDCEVIGGGVGAGVSCPQ